MASRISFRSNTQAATSESGSKAIGGPGESGAAHFLERGEGREIASYSVVLCVQLHQKGTLSRCSAANIL